MPTRQALLRHLSNDGEVKTFKQQASLYLDTCLGAIARAVWQRTPDTPQPDKQTRVYVRNAPRAFKDKVLLPLTVAVPLGFMSVDPRSDAPFVLLCEDPPDAEPDVVVDSSLFETEVLLPDDCIARHRVLKALFLLVAAKA